MAHQVPSSKTAETRGFAGPFLRFGSGTGPQDGSRWHGSVLCLTRGTGAAAAGAAKVGAPSVAWPAGPTAAGSGDGTAAAAWPGADAAAAQVHSEAPCPVLLLSGAQPGGGGGEEQALEPVALDACDGWTAWRFDLELYLGEGQRGVRYRVESCGSSTPTYTFWLPGLGQPMHWAYYSCNGFTDDVKADAPERADPTYLWRDMLQLHSAFPLHCLVGGGDQVYNDGIWQVPALQEWGCSTDHDKKVAAAWTPEMEAEATRYYLTNYIDTFSGPDIDLAYAQIPSVMMWDDHDIWDGYGSYEGPMQRCDVFQGLFRVARRFFLLFQQHTTDAFNAQAREFLTNDGSEFHFLKYMGPQVVLLGMDMRSQRSKESIMPQASYDLFRRVVAGLPQGPLHLAVMSGIPVIFPKIPGSEQILFCTGNLLRRTPLVKQLARTTGILDRFDKPEILDDLIDGWVADEHEDERLKFIRLLQEFQESKRLRVSILSGDAHVGGVGRFYSRPKVKDPGQDPLLMMQIISSAIVNAPPPHPVVRMLMRTNFASNVDGRTREKLVRAFYPWHPRTDKLIAQRNWCDISLVAPPFSPPTVPQDPQFGGLRFVLRVENAHHRRGYADETYIQVAPRHPQAATLAAPRAAAGLLPSGSPVPAGVPLSVSEGLTEASPQQMAQPAAKHRPPANTAMPEAQPASATPAAAAGERAPRTPVQAAPLVIV